MQITCLHHVQITIPKGAEDEARRFYCEGLGLMEIAEKEQRTAPGVTGEDFRPFFAVLAKGGYKGRITVEGRWNAEQLKNAFAEMKRQAGEVA